MQSYHQSAWRPAWQLQVDGVIDVRTDPLQVCPQRHRLLVSGEVAGVAPARPRELELAGGKLRLAETGIQQQREVGVETFVDHAFEETCRIASDPTL